MDRNKKKIISIGGGGFTHETDEDLDQFVVNQLNVKNFKIGFLPTASKDDKKKVDLFYGIFNTGLTPKRDIKYYNPKFETFIKKRVSFIATV